MKVQQQNILILQIPFEILSYIQHQMKLFQLSAFFSALAATVHTTQYITKTITSTQGSSERTSKTSSTSALGQQQSKSISGSTKSYLYSGTAFPKGASTGYFTDSFESKGSSISTGKQNQKQSIFRFRDGKGSFGSFQSGQGAYRSTFGEGRGQGGFLNSYKIINQASDNLVVPNRSLDSIFLRFPSCGELDRIIISADIAAILKTIQSVATDGSVSCNQRIVYLLELLGRLKTAIEKKVYSANQLKIVIDTSVSEIERLQSEIDIAKKGIVGLAIGSLKERQAVQIASLQEAYLRLNSVDEQTPVLQAQVFGYQKEIEILSKNTESERSKIANDKLKLVDVSNQITTLKARLRELQEKQTNLNESIAKGQSKVSQNDRDIKLLRKKIEQIQIQIKKFKDQSDKVNALVKDLQVKVERLRTDIAIAETKRERFSKQITLFDDKINIEKKKAVQDDLNRLNEVITTLRGLVPSVQNAIDRHYYNCFGQGNNIKIEQSGEVVVYVISGDKLGDYLKNFYGSSVQVPSIRSDITFNRVNIFGKDWFSNFGYPFVDSAFGASDFSFSGSFNCLSPGSVVSGCGTIVNIGSNFIEAKDEKGKTSKFSLGSCSRLQSSLRIPKVGQRFYWSGVPGGQGVNLYGASCFD